VDGFDKLGKTSLPPKSKFFSKLNNEDISDADYKRALNVWNVFDMKTMKDYHDLYLKTDVLLLADVMENFRKVYKANYGLVPLWYYTAPGLAWDAALKLTEVELELISHPDMYLFTEKVSEVESVPSPKDMQQQTISISGSQKYQKASSNV
jgi:hypothetical protein